VCSKGVKDLKKIVASMMALIISLSMLPLLATRAEENETEYWALIVCGGPPINPQLPGNFLPNTEYMNHMLREHYDFDANHVNYLYDRTNLRKSHVRTAIRNYVHLNLTDENDVIFMYFSSHGNIRYDNQTTEDPGEYYDEGDEYRECTIKADLNGDGEWNTTDWVGEDESIGIARVVEDPMWPYCEFDEYWDDELAEDLDYLKENNAYGTLIVVRQGCRGGGLIDDISDSNRIVMTAASEMGDSASDRDGDGFSEWSEVFIDALHGHNTSYVGGQIVDEGSAIDADVNNDGRVSLLEAWEYAWDNDDARISGEEEPWMDDNGDGYPTHKNETDVFVPGDGEPTGLAATTWLSPPIINGHEQGNVNHPGAYYHWNYTELGYGIDLQVNQTDLDLMGLAFFTFDWEPWGIGEGLYNPDADINLDGLVDTRDISIACRHWQLSYEQYWDGYKYEKKTVGGSVTETIDFYNRTDFILPLGQEKYVDVEQVVDTYAAADWKPRYAFSISNGTQGQKYFEEGWFYFAWANP